MTERTLLIALQRRTQDHDYADFEAAIRGLEARRLYEDVWELDTRNYSDRKICHVLGQVAGVNDRLCVATITSRAVYGKIPPAIVLPSHVQRFRFPLSKLGRVPIGRRRPAV